MASDTSIVGSVVVVDDVAVDVVVDGSVVEVVVGAWVVVVVVESSLVSDEHAAAITASANRAMRTRGVRWNMPGSLGLHIANAMFSSHDEEGNDETQGDEAGRLTDDE